MWHCWSEFWAQTSGHREKTMHFFPSPFLKLPMLLFHPYRCPHHLQNPYWTFPCLQALSTPFLLHRFRFPLVQTLNGLWGDVCSLPSAVPLTDWSMYCSILLEMPASFPETPSSMVPHSDVLFLYHDSRILIQSSYPVCGSWKSQASSPWAKQHRV